MNGKKPKTTGDILSMLAETIYYPCGVCNEQGEFLWVNEAARNLESACHLEPESQEVTPPLGATSSSLLEHIGRWVRRHWEVLCTQDGIFSLRVSDLPVSEAHLVEGDPTVLLQGMKGGNEPLVVVTVVPGVSNPHVGRTPDHAQQTEHPSDPGPQGKRAIQGDEPRDADPPKPKRKSRNAKSTKQRRLSRVPGLETLTPRERDIALMAAQGYSAPNIAATLGIAESTVYSHLKKIYRKLDIHNRVQLTLLCLQIERA